MRAAFRNLLRLAAVACIVLGVACADDGAPVSAPPPPKPAVPVRMLALGDSYTKGESVPVSKSWPYQLEVALLPDSVRVTSLKVVAYTGWTTADLLVAIQKNKLKPEYDLVTLQIGVNNQYGGYPFDQFQTEFPELLAKASALAGDRPDHVVVLSIPDYTVTPVGSRVDPDVNRSELDSYNAFIAATLDSTETALVNITDISRLAQDDSSLVARDGLHYSGKMYAEWVDVIRPVVARIFGRGKAAK